MEDKTNRVIIECLLPAPAEEVWEAWTNPFILLNWIGSDAAGKGLEATLDVRQGGGFSFCFQNGDQTRYTASGAYTSVIEPHHLAFSWMWANEPGHSSSVDISLTQQDDGTRMLFHHQGLDPASAHDYQYGWNSTFSKLQRILLGRRLLQRFNTAISQWIGFLDDYTLEMLRQPPGAGSWSLGQVYIHIIDDTGYFAAQMKESLGSTADSDKEMHENAGTMLRNNAFPDMMIKGPATGKVIEQPQNKDRLLQALLSIREEVNNLYSSVNLAGATGKTRHPGLLYFTTLEWLQFAEMHMRHHLRQKKRIDEQVFISRP